MSSIYNVLFVFFLGFFCFIAGWFAAVWVFSGNVTQISSYPMENKEHLSDAKLNTIRDKKKDRLYTTQAYLKDTDFYSRDFSDEDKKSMGDNVQQKEKTDPPLQQFVSAGIASTKTAVQENSFNRSLNAVSVVSDEKKDMPLSATASQTITPLLKEIKDNILILFDPYRVDSLIETNYLKTPQESSVSDFAALENDNLQNKIKEKSLQTVTSVVYLPFKDSSAVLKKEKSLPFKVSSAVKSNRRDPFEPTYQTQMYSLGLGDSYRKSENLSDDTIKKLQLEYDKKNRQQLANIAGRQPFFTLDGKIGFLINGFSDHREALEYVDEMKSQYPMWSFLIKAHQGHVSIYLGPFTTKEKALEFKDNLPLPNTFILGEPIENI